MKNINTKFPQYIDERIFFQDINLTQVPIMNHYYSLLNSNNYEKASEFLNNSEVFFYGAWILNLLEERLCTIGSYLLNLPPKEPLVDYQEDQPTSANKGTHWISSKEDIRDIDGSGTWEILSNYTWKQLSNYTWQDVKTLKENPNGE